MSTDRSDLGRALAALRPRRTVTCVECGHQWDALIRPHADQPLTCSPACRQKRWRRAKKADTTLSEENPGA